MTSLASLKKPLLLAALRKSLYWQEYVARVTTNPVQRARCEAAAARLAEQIKEMENSNG